ncbi:hypothetical protein RDWZM_006868 [Blomia tropicalis]|uniref:Uncharacterized protein n=1 Tax=Blomia tropicalis TaxID=40697 RepID=A0A9Q0M7V3_BLOTA|nr:hypothetical protein RDWZM_006868 [Blomia tropicalis]
MYDGFHKYAHTYNHQPFLSLYNDTIKNIDDDEKEEEEDEEEEEEMVKDVDDDFDIDNRNITNLINCTMVPCNRSHWRNPMKQVEDVLEIIYFTFIGLSFLIILCSICLICMDKIYRQCCKLQLRIDSMQFRAGPQQQQEQQRRTRRSRRQQQHQQQQQQQQRLQFWQTDDNVYDV